MNSTESLILDIIQTSIRKKIDFTMEQEGDTVEIDENLNDNKSSIHIKIPDTIKKNKKLDKKLISLLNRIKSIP